MDDLDTSIDLHVSYSLFQTLGDRSKGKKFIRYNYYFHVTQIFSDIESSKYFPIFKLSFIFTIWFWDWDTCRVVAILMDCNFMVRDFKLGLCYFVYFRTNTLEKGINTFIPPPL